MRDSEPARVDFLAFLASALLATRHFSRYPSTTHARLKKDTQSQAPTHLAADFLGYPSSIQRFPNCNRRRH